MASQGLSSQTDEDGGWALLKTLVGLEAPSGQSPHPGFLSQDDLP